MASLNINGQFQTAIQNLVLPLLQDPNKVGLVMRWNQNDNFLWTFWSLPVGQIIVPGGGACHAEEVMIASWTQCLVQAGIDSPDLVEIFLSQSPCANRSQPRQFMGTFWPQGCCNKLHALASVVEAQVREWRIAFFRYYQEGQWVDAQVYGAIAILGNINNLDIYFYKERHNSI